MESNEQPPGNWGAWRQCQLCRVLRKTLTPEGICPPEDAGWCLEVRSSKVSTNGVKSPKIWRGEVAIDTDPPVSPVQKKKRGRKPAKR